MHCAESLDSCRIEIDQTTCNYAPAVTIRGVAGAAHLVDGGKAADRVVGTFLGGSGGDWPNCEDRKGGKRKGRVDPAFVRQRMQRDVLFTSRATA